MFDIRWDNRLQVISKNNLKNVSITLQKHKRSPLTFNLSKYQHRSCYILYTAMGCHNSALPLPPKAVLSDSFVIGLCYLKTVRLGAICTHSHFNSSVTKKPHPEHVLEQLHSAIWSIGCWISLCKPGKCLWKVHSDILSTISGHIHFFLQTLGSASVCHTVSRNMDCLTDRQYLWSLHGGDDAK